MIGARTAIAPSGEQVELSRGDQRVVVVEVGGGLRSYSVGDREVLDGYGVDERATSGRGQLLTSVAEPPRRRERYEYDGVSEQLALTEARAPPMRSTGSSAGRPGGWASGRPTAS